MSVGGPASGQEGKRDSEMGFGGSLFPTPCRCSGRRDRWVSGTCVWHLGELDSAGSPGSYWDSGLHLLTIPDLVSTENTNEAASSRVPHLLSSDTCPYFP